MKLTDEQVANWREVLVAMLGPYALIAPRERIERLVEAMQRKLDDWTEDDEVTR